jgi:hypothetical protein
MNKLDADGREAADLVLADPRVERVFLARTIFNVSNQIEPAVAAAAVKDLHTLVRLKGSALDGLLHRAKGESVVDRLAAGALNHVKGALLELNVGAELVRGNRQLSAVGIVLSPGDELRFGEKRKTDDSRIAGPDKGQSFMSFGVRRETIEADVVIVKKHLTTTECIGIDPKFRTNRKLNLDGFKPGNLQKKGRATKEEGLEDQLRGVMVAIERQDFSTFVLLTTTEFAADVHEAVELMNSSLAERGYANDPIKLVEHYAP